MTDKHHKNWKKIKESADVDYDEDLDEVKDTDSDSEQAALAHPSYPELEEKLTLAEQKAHESWEKSMRAMAELDNVRRRAERDVEQAHRYGQGKLVAALIPVLDSLDQAIGLSGEHKDKAMTEGLELTRKLFIDALHQHQVEAIDPMGLAFNPQEHEAMSIQETNEVAPNTVVAVFQKGYKLSDRVIRPARVIVSKAATGA